MGNSLGPVVLTTKDYPLIDKKVLNVSRWFKTETLEIIIGDSYGLPRPGMLPQALGWFIADGWTIKSKEKTQTTNVYRKNFTIHEWSKSTTYKLERRSMQSENVLQDMISEFTTAYNEGRKINNDRYREIVAAYVSMVDTTQSAVSTELGSTDKNGVDFEELVTWIVNSLKSGLNDFKDLVESALQKFGVARREEIERKYANELARARKNLVDKGLYNNTIYQSISSRILTDKQLALNDLDERLAKETISTGDLALRVRADISGKILDAYRSYVSLLADKKLPLINARNTVYKWMLDFMERRNDQYPSMENLLTLAQGLGYAKGGTVSPGA